MFNNRNNKKIRDLNELPPEIRNKIIEAISKKGFRPDDIISAKILEVTDEDGNDIMKSFIDALGKEVYDIKDCDCSACRESRSKHNNDYKSEKANSLKRLLSYKFDNTRNSEDSKEIDRLMSKLEKLFAEESKSDLHTGSALLSYISKFTFDQVRTELNRVKKLNDSTSKLDPIVASKLNEFGKLLIMSGKRTEDLADIYRNVFRSLDLMNEFSDLLNDIEIDKQERYKDLK